ncbi:MULTISPECIES: hypothetical protein [unclassified Methylobacterium]|uniref:hypothetical protein n=1 Tax=unclassified Methylobacterium TaxID=2615210 RepID=UPI001FBBEA74|nr:MULTISPECIES: hypothetical protein [unclassified Methylobacterium]MCJ2096533.1 hypothetical protein [Methylobacterium sp. J-072]MCJ2141904.1 hypothetical protein [Methylobacterium sp. E-066]
MLILALRVNGRDVHTDGKGEGYEGSAAHDRLSSDRQHSYSMSWHSSSLQDPTGYTP